MQVNLLDPVRPAGEDARKDGPEPALM